MKNILAILTIFLAQQSFACIDYDSETQICPGETVYAGTFEGSSYPMESTLLGVNQLTKTVTVNFIELSRTKTKGVTELHITRGCVDKACVGDLIYMGASVYLSGATIVAVNPHRGTLVVKSKSSGSLSFLHSKDADVVYGCIYDTCVGDTVYHNSVYSSGATVIAINRYDRTVTVKPLDLDALGVIHLQDVSLARGCVYGICVGNTVYHGSIYPSGATVVATNYQNRTVIVKSIGSDFLRTEDPKDLDVTTRPADYDQSRR